MTYVDRSIFSVFQEATRAFAVVMLTGPRQSGKTTFLRQQIMPEGYKLLSLDEPATRNFAKEDPVGFIERNPPPVILDEIQYAAEVLPVIKNRVDENRKPGQWILTGSQQFQMMRNITESLAGRGAILSLLPFSLSEAQKVHSELASSAWIFAGGYPEVVIGRASRKNLWMNSYLQTYLERDIRNLRQVGDLHQFELFLRALAARSAQILNYSDISRDIGISVPTAKQWVSILESSYTIFTLPPYFRNVGKRLIKAPKMYFLDTGLMSALLGYRSGAEILSGPLAGPFFETGVVAELIKLFHHAGMRPPIYYWRTRDGHEVDVLIESNGSILPIEIKSTATPTAVHLKSMNLLRRLMPDAGKTALLICRVKEETPMAHDSLALPWNRIEHYLRQHDMFV